MSQTRIPVLIPLNSQERFCGFIYRVNEVAQSCPTFATPWTIAYQAPPSMGFSRQECWSGLPFASSGDLPDPGIEPGSPTLQADALPSEPPGKPLSQCLRVTSLSCWEPDGRLWLG